MPQKNKLNLGSGIDYKEGWINSDLEDKDYIGNKIKVDIPCDLNKFPYPFKTDQFEFILMNNVLTYIRDINKFVLELRRIMKLGAEIKIRVPHFTHWGGYAEPYVANRFALNSVGYFNIFEKNGFNLISKRFESNQKIINNLYSIINLSSFIQKIYERFFIYIFPAQDIIWRFRKIIQ